ncbi:nucleolar complex protein 3 homolog [Cydia strobilella]|uniref:nucleolar complex protein 3 homolog n=1 Tax=Cydia strobilella TaxID=1100964 RepID=UPI003006868C
MSKKGKVKVSKVKRNNQTTNRMKKQGKMKLQRHREKLQKQNQPPPKPEIEYSSESEESADEWGDMLDDEEKTYIMKRLAKNPRFLADVPLKDDENKSSRKRRKIDKEKVPKKQPQLGSDSGAESDSASESDFEEKYEQEMAERPAKRMRALLPIKTKQGLMERTEEYADTESEREDDPEPQKEVQTKEEEPQGSDSDSGMEGTGEEDTETPEGGVVSTVELMAARRDRLNHEKLRIGALCSSLLEEPEKKLKNLYPILYLMEERLKDETLNLHSVRKIATLSAYEVFKDILPDYQIRHQDYSNVKLKKDTLALYKYEKELLEFYKRYLQKLEKACTVLRPKKGDTRKPDPAAVSLALVSLRCLCGLLVARPQFNYATNIAQTTVPVLDCGNADAADIATECAQTVFQEDTKGEITLTIVRLINQLVKRRGERLKPTALRCLLSLKIRDVDLDAEADVKHKKKMEEKHKKRIVNLSKKEKKRAKKLKEVERELLETEAQESEVSRRKQLTEVTKTVFHIYFRLLKTAPRSKLLCAALDGLAKFTHVINLEYYSDLVAILARLTQDELIGSRERLLCVRCVLAILAGSGDAINVDPGRFHTALYAAMLTVHAGKTHDDAKIVLESVAQICARARRVSADELAAFAKRLATLALQLQHNGALACLALLHQLAQQSKAVESLFEPDAESGAGHFDPTLESPAHCHARAAVLAELCALQRHYHPAVRQAVTKSESKLSAVHIFEQYDGSQMAFKPSIPPPKPTSKAKVPPTHVWAQHDFKQLCEDVENKVNFSEVDFAWPKKR